MEQEYSGAEERAAGSRVGPIVVYVLGLLVGIGTIVAALLLTYGGTYELFAVFMAGVCVVVCVMAVAAARAWPDRWWRWGIPPAAVCAVPVVFFIPRIVSSPLDTVEGILAWGGISAACFAAGLLGGWMGQRLHARRANLPG